MYVLEGRDTIKHEWRKRKLSFVADRIPIKTVHRFGEHRGGVVRFYQFENDEEHNLGKEPLPSVTVRVNDNDAAGVTITETGHETQLMEGGSTAPFTVSFAVGLTRKPLANVAVSLTTGSQLSLSYSRLTFTPGNWLPFCPMAAVGSYAYYLRVLPFHELKTTPCFATI